MVSRILRVGIMAAAVLFTVLALLGFRDYARSPYTGILHHNLVVQGLAPGSPNGMLPLEPGDRICAVDGEVPRNLNHFSYLTGSNTSLESQVYRIERGDSLFDMTVQAIAQPLERFYRKFGMMVAGCVFMLVGFIVVLKRPDVLGFLFAVLCILLCFLVTERPITSIRFFHIAGELVHDFLFIFLPAFIFHFLLLFPGKEIKRGTRRSTAIRYLYLPPIVLFVASFVMALVHYSSGVPRELISIFEAAIALYWLGYIIASIASFIRTYMLSERVQRIKFRVVFFGVALGIIPISVVMLIMQFKPAAYVPLLSLAEIFLSFISISFAYAILKHGAFDLGIVFRKFLAFAILAGFLVAFYFFLVYLLGERFGTFLGIKPSVVTVISIILLALVLVPVRAGIQWVLDALFARRRQIFREEILEFSRLIQFHLSTDELAGFIAREMIKLFDAEHVHLFLKEQSGNYALKSSEPLHARIPLTSFPPRTDLIKLIRNSRLPMMIEYFDSLWIRNALDRISQELISLSRASVVVPLIEGRELFGFILIGGKKSGKPYMPADAEVLELLGERSAAAIRNIELYRDSIEKEKLEEELHLASEIQKHLLPESVPKLETASIKGDIRMTREVGGDFYDFVELRPGKVGIAVADVAGKGVPASILMTNLKASFRTEASDDRAPAEVLSALNTTLFERSDAIRFATFFYAIYEEKSGILHYSNGGSQPPFIIRKDGNVTRLLRGGMPIGVDADSTYKEGIVKMKEGDLAIFFSDGILDQENDQGEHYGEKRLIEFFRNNVQMSLEMLIEKLFATLFAFGHNNMKDDMTIVLLRKNIP